MSLLELSPNPVTIQAGGHVDWYENDGLGPYTIGFGDYDIYFQTPYGLTFPYPGTYSYMVSSEFGGLWYGTVIVTQGTPNSPPSVRITSPANNAVFTAPATFDFEAEASDPDNNLWDVWFYVEDDVVAEIVDAPYKTTITGLPAGTYELYAQAWDYFEEYDVDWVTITVVDSVPGPINLAVTRVAGGKLEFEASGLTAGKSVVLQSSSGFETTGNWLSVSTNVVNGTTASFTNSITPGRRFFRVVQLP